jgi:single-stranded DNA-binding protein
MNNCYFIGKISEDLTINTEYGCSVCDFVIEVEEKWHGKTDGKKNVIKTMLNCTAWDKGADALYSKFVKGDMIFIEGSLRHDDEGIDYVRVNSFRKVF